MINQEKKREILQHILRSNEFAGSKSNKALLTYLIESSIKGITPKETTIAIEALGRDKNFNPNEDTIVRVYLHNLRKKLEAYYNNEGKNDKIRVEIPKGHYSVDFVRTFSKLNHRFKNHSKILNLFLASIVFLLGISLLLLLHQNREMSNKLKVQNGIDKGDVIWSKYLQNDFPILLVLGNHYFFREYNKKLGKWRYIRDFTINSEKDFENFKTQNPDLLLDVSKTQYFPDNSILGLPDILSVLKGAKQPFYLRRSSDVTVEDLKEYNLIFIGSIKTLGILDRYLNNPEISYSLHPYTLLYKEVKYDTISIYKTQGDPNRYHRDVAIILKCSGLGNNEILIITSFFTSGVTEAVKFLTQPVLLHQIENNFKKQYGFVPRNFNIIFTVKGFATTGLYANILEMKKITAFNPWK